MKSYDVLYIGNYTKDTIVAPSGTKIVDGGAVNYAAPFAATNLSVATDLSFGVRNGQRAMFYVNEGNGQLRKIVGPNAATTQAAGPAYVGSTPTPTPVPPIVTNPGSYAYTAYPAAQRVYDFEKRLATMR